jgi:hypothetical protein
MAAGWARSLSSRALTASSLREGPTYLYILIEDGKISFFPPTAVGAACTSGAEKIEELHGAE